MLIYDKFKMNNGANNYLKNHVKSANNCLKNHVKGANNRAKILIKGADYDMLSLVRSFGGAYGANCNTKTDRME